MNNLDRCVRCRKKTQITIMSKFNTDIICMDCKDKEREHPQFKRAVDAELAACMRGDYNFPGIGKPADL